MLLSLLHNGWIKSLMSRCVETLIGPCLAVSFHFKNSRNLDENSTIFTHLYFQPHESLIKMVLFLGTGAWVFGDPAQAVGPLRLRPGRELRPKQQVGSSSRRSHPQTQPVKVRKTLTKTTSPSSYSSSSMNRQNVSQNIASPFDIWNADDKESIQPLSCNFNYNL